MDVVLFQTPDGGEIDVQNGIVRLDGGLQTAAYLSLFGGNLADAGGQQAEESWWGNIGETETARQYRSETQYLLGSIPPTSFNLNRLRSAAERDLAWFISESVASSVDVSVSLSERDKVSFEIVIQAEGPPSQFKFTANWEASA